MRRTLSRLDPWAPPLALMGVIWLLSDQPDLSSGLGVIDLVGRKIVHAGAFGLLCFLWWRAFRTRLPPRATMAAGFVMAVAYGAVDELHQTSVPGRHGSPVDVAIDATGAVIALLVIRRRGTARPERRLTEPTGRAPAEPGADAFAS